MFNFASQVTSLDRLDSLNILLRLMDFHVPIKMSVFKVRVGAEGTLEVFLACVRFQMSLEIRIFEELLAANIAFELWISVINLVRFHSVFGTEDLSAGFTWMSLQLMSVLMSFQVPFISKLCAVCEDKIKVDFFESNWTLHSPAFVAMKLPFII